MSMKERQSLLNDLEDNSDDVDGDLEMKVTKSDTQTEEEEENDSKSNKSKTKDDSQSEATQSPASTERRSSRIMTRKQRDSELRLQFTKKLKVNPQTGPKKVFPNSPRRFSKSDLNTSDSEPSSPALVKKSAAPSSSGGVSKKPLVLGNKRKSSLEYAKNRKLIRKEAADTTTTTDDNEDTEESDYKHNVKRKANQTKIVKKKPKPEPTDESDSETDSEPDLEKELKKAISTKFTSYKNSPDSTPNNNHIAKRPVGRPSLKSKQAAATPSMKLGSTPNRTVPKIPMDRQFKNQIVGNVKNPNLFPSNANKKIDSIKIYYPNIEKRDSVRNSAKNVVNQSVNNRLSSTSIAKANPPAVKPAAHASPKVKSEFDKLVDELFETETTKEKVNAAKPETMMINNEPTDVYTLSIDDTLEDEESDDNLESLCEEVYEDEEVVTGKPSVTASTTASEEESVISKPLRVPPTSAHIMNINSPLLMVGKNRNGLPTHVAPGSFQSPSGQSTISRLSGQSAFASVKKPPPASVQKATITPVPVKPRVAITVDYKEKYNKLHTSYEMLSKKIAQYMDKTKGEKEQLKRQLKVEKAKLSKAQEDIQELKRKFHYLMKGRPEVKKKMLRTL